jgi:hypothetical protein
VSAFFADTEPALSRAEGAGILTFAVIVSAGAPSYREAKGGAFDFFHHKNPVRTITDF